MKSVNEYIFCHLLTYLEVLHFGHDNVSERTIVALPVCLVIVFPMWRVDSRENGRHLIKKIPYTYGKLEKLSDNRKNATKMFAYTAISDRLRTTSFSNDNHPKCVVKLV